MREQGRTSTQVKGRHDSERYILRGGRKTKGKRVNIGENEKGSAKVIVSMAEGLPMDTYVCQTSSKNSGLPFSLLVWRGERMGREWEAVRQTDSQYGGGIAY
jgi:hypothetical protein